MVKRLLGGAFFLIGLIGLLGFIVSPPRDLPADSAERAADLVVTYGVFVLFIGFGLLLRRAGAPQPVHAPRRRDGDDEYDDEPRPRLARVVVPGKRVREDGEDEWEPRTKTGTCATCGYRRVAYNADYCPVCAARNPNPDVVNRYVGRAMLLGMLVGSLAGAVGGFFGLGHGGVGGAIGGFLLGALPGMFLGLVGGALAGWIARLSGAR